jgi:hypothetical protein
MDMDVDLEISIRGELGPDTDAAQYYSMVTKCSNCLFEGTAWIRKGTVFNIAPCPVCGVKGSMERLPEARGAEKSD